MQTLTTIQHLIQTVPDEMLPQFNLGGIADTAVPGLPGIDAGTTRQVIAFKQVDFGWKFCQIVAGTGLEFPVLHDREDDVLFRAWVHLLNPQASTDFEIRTALTFMTKRREHDRRALKAALISPDCTVEKAAAIAQVDPVVVRIFEKLFFNIIDRKNDIMYVMSILFPSGRNVELNQGYMVKENTESLVMRAGWQNGVDDALFMAGGSNKALQEIARSNSTSELENTLMGYGMLMARNGGMGQSGRDLPSLSAAPPDPPAVCPSLYFLDVPPQVCSPNSPHSRRNAHTPKGCVCVAGSLGLNDYPPPSLPRLSEIIFGRRPFDRGPNVSCRSEFDSNSVFNPALTRFTPGPFAFTFRINSSLLTAPSVGTSAINSSFTSTAPFFTDAADTWSVVASFQ